jgi:hypothetical protein
MLPPGAKALASSVKMAVERPSRRRYIDLRARTAPSSDLAALVRPTAHRSDSLASDVNQCHRLARIEDVRGVIAIASFAGPDERIGATNRSAAPDQGVK